MNLKDFKLILKGTNVWLIYLLLNVVIPYGLSTTDQLVSDSLNSSPVAYLEALVGEHILLPCDVTPPNPQDAPILVLFYREENKTPIYSLDSRGSNISSGIHWTATNLERRAYVKTLPQVQGLVLENLVLSDAGLYRCRVDFKASPTRNSKVEIKVIDPPKRISITSTWEGDRMTKDVIGPYPEGAQITLSCKVVGGVPPPLVTWWHGGSLLDDQSEVRSGGMTRNSLYLPKLTRLDLLKMLTCQALNSNLTTPLTKTVTIDLAYPPSSIRISSNSNQDEIEGQVKIPHRVTCIEGEECPLECKVDGSRPPPLVTWKTSERTLEAEFKTISSPPGVKNKGTADNDSFFSTLMLTANASDNDALISCRASSPALRNQAIEDSIQLNVLYKPQLKLKVKDRADLNNVEEGEDLELECFLSSNPKVYEIQWTHNWIPLVHNASAGVYIGSSGSKLVLKKVGSNLGGQFACAAANTRGSGTSNVIELRIKFVPKCSTDQRRSVGIGKMEISNVTCRVKAHPPPTVFRWAFNSSRELIEIPFDQQIEKNDSSNTIRYTPRSPFDYGDLVCWASNALGTMKNPCIITIIPVDKPEGVRSCKIYPNGTEPDGHSTVIISCHPGWDGGLTQTFTLEVRESVSEKLLSVVQNNRKASFQIGNLKPGGHFLFTVTSANPRGTSPPVTLTYKTPEEVLAGLTNKHSKPKGTFMKYMPFLVIFFALIVVCTSCASIIACIAKSRAHEKANRAKEMQKESTISIRKVSSNSHSSLPDRGKLDEVDEEMVIKTPDQYCAIHGHERQENEYISYKHYFNNMRDDFETQHLLKSSMGGSVGMDNNCSNNSRDSISSFNCADHRKGTLSEYTLRSNQQRYSDESFKGLAPLASVDSLSGFSSTASNHSSKKGGDTSSQKSFPVIHEMISMSSSSEEDQELLKKSCNAVLREPLNAPRRYIKSLSQLPYFYNKFDGMSKPLFATYNPSSSSYISEPSTSYGFTRPVAATLTSHCKPASLTTLDEGCIIKDQQNVITYTENSMASNIPTLPPPMMDTHPIFSGYPTRCRQNSFDDQHKTWYASNGARSSSRESSV